jgi:hypothetical protein
VSWKGWVDGREFDLREERIMEGKKQRSKKKKKKRETRRIAQKLEGKRKQRSQNEGPRWPRSKLIDKL